MLTFSRILIGVLLLLRVVLPVVVVAVAVVVATSRLRLAPSRLPTRARSTVIPAPPG